MRRIHTSPSVSRSITDRLLLTALTGWRATGPRWLPPGPPPPPGRPGPDPPPPRRPPPGRRVAQALRAPRRGRGDAGRDADAVIGGPADSQTGLGGHAGPDPGHPGQMADFVLRQRGSPWPAP